MPPILRQILRAIRVNGSTVVRSRDSLRGKFDLPSIQKFVDSHIDKLVNSKTIKGEYSSDQKTTDIAKKVLLDGDKKENSDFLQQNILNQPSYSTSELGSIEVSIEDIYDHKKYLRDYKKLENKESLIFIGGPAAEDSTVIASLVESVRDGLEDILFITKNYNESNVNHSAHQSHARHSNALNADRNLTGHSLFPTLIARKILGTDLEDVLDSDYKKIDVAFTIDPKKLRIYFANELNWLKQEYKRRNGELTEHDMNRMEALLSQDIMNVINNEGELDIVGSKGSSSIHVAFSEKNEKEITHENQLFAKSGIKSEKLTIEEIEFLFQNEKDIVGAWKYEGDTHTKFDAHEKNRKFSENNGVIWIEENEVKSVLLAKNSDGKARVAGVILNNGDYHYASGVHLTLGYKGKYKFEKTSETRLSSQSSLRNVVNRVEDIFGLKDPVSDDMTTATGVSINAIFRKSDKIKKIIEKYGSTGEIAITNSHWTMIAHNDDYLLMRITGGGNTGSEEYQPSYFLNTIANTRRIFGDDLIGIVSTYGCSRALNAKNSTEFAKIAEGLIVSYGKGGTGNTKRHIEASIGLMMLGFEDEIVEYFNKFKNREDKDLGDEVKKMYKLIKNSEFYHDNTKQTNQRMGYDNSLSLDEMVVLGLIMLATSFVLHKNLSKDKEKDNLNNVGTSIRPVETTTLVNQNKTINK